uniref:Retrotransposon gag domain-containing protein n=1 Tax=Lactuca sativa TaxID=4236 RepID=A0A9R1UYY3_LACSA|nr:hypothetical protein LSAT_V11C700380360 [Lactuca sativa]
MPRRSSTRLNLNQQPEPEQQQPQPPPPETNPPISSVELEEIIAQRIVVALANVTRGGVRNEGNVRTARMMLVDEYCPREEIHKLEQELWTLTMKGSEKNAYTSRFNDLVVICPALVTPDYKKIERYIWGIALQIKGMVIASKPKTYDSAKRIANHLTSTETQVGFIAESPEFGMNKRKFNGKNPIQSFEERQEVETNYAATTAIPLQPRKYVGKLPMCTQCNRHHIANCSWCSQCNRQHAGDCYICMKCKKKGYTTSYCRSTVTPGFPGILIIPFIFGG